MIFKRLQSTFIAAIIIALTSNTFAQTTYGIFEEQDSIIDRVFIGYNADIFIWSDSYIPYDEDHYFGYGTLAFEPADNGSIGWAGFGLLLMQPTDLNYFVNGHYNFSLKVDSSETADFEIGLDCHSGYYSVNFVLGNEPNGFKRDGQWHDLSIALKDFIPNDDFITNEPAPEMGDTTLSSVGNILRVSGLVKFAIDEVYLSTGLITRNNEIDNEAMNIYPNPASAVIYIPDFQYSKSVKIINSIGKLEFEINNTTSTNIDISSLSTGIYTVHVSTKSNSWSSAFSKN